MKVLVYGNRKMDDVIFDASTPVKRATACLRVFELLDEEWQVYADLDDVDPNLDDGRPSQDRRWRDLRDKARHGDAAAAETLMTQRSRAGYEYEHIRFTEVENPLTPEEKFLRAVAKSRE